MERRDILKITGLTLGYSVLGLSATALLQGCKAETKPDWIPQFFTSDEAILLEEICESILPATDTPGAKDALAHRYLDEMALHFLTEDQKNHIKQALVIFDEKSKAKFSKAFVALNVNEKEEVLGLVIEALKDYDDENGTKPHIFNLIKENTIIGYFTSEVGAKGGLGKFLPIPGPYQGCIDYATVGSVYVL